jgi:hypothetical protein
MFLGQVLKNGTIIEKVDIKDKEYIVIGRNADTCAVVMEVRLSTLSRAKEISNVFCSCPVCPHLFFLKLFQPCDIYCMHTVATHWVPLKPRPNKGVSKAFIHML